MIHPSNTILTRQQTRKQRRKEAKICKAQTRKLKTAMQKLSLELFQKAVKDLNPEEQQEVTQTFFKRYAKS